MCATSSERELNSPLLQTLRSQGLTSTCYFTFRVPNDLYFSPCGHAGVVLPLITAIECALLGWIPVNRCMCAVWLVDSLSANSNRLKPQCFSIESVYVLVAHRSLGAEDELYRKYLIWFPNECGGRDASHSQQGWQSGRMGTGNHDRSE